MPRQRIDLTNQTFGALTALRYIGGRRSLWQCACACGSTTNKPDTHLRTGSVKSCGCMQHRGRNG